MFLEYDFMRNAVFAMFLLSVIAGIVGTYIVVRRMVFVAGGITHASFGGIGIAYYLGVSPIVGALVFAVLTALGAECLGGKARVRTDSAIAMLWSLGMAVGVIFMFLTPGYAPNLMGFMFGDILAVSDVDVVSLLIMALIVICGALLFYRPIMYTSFSPAYARIAGWRVRLISALMSVVVAVAIVLSIKAVGIVLILSMFTIPQSIANFFVGRLNRMMILSTIISVVGGMAGLAIAVMLNLPVGAVVTAFLVILLIIIRLIIKIKK